METPSLHNIKKVLVANRGEIAVRCIRACRELGVRSVAIFTNADATSLHVSLADEAILLPGSEGTAYTDGHAILEICKDNAVDAIIPGYGFLSENAEFAQATLAAGIVFVGPSADAIKAMGLKHEARDIARTANVPIVPGTGLLSSAKEAVDSAKELGFPIMLKATGGGGGMGLQICNSEQEVEEAFALVESRAGALFKNSGVFLEKYYPRSRHIEVQVAGNGDVVVAFGERECSLQRRHQKVIEECPSPFVERNPGLREKLIGSAISYASQLKYKSVGTVEFLVDDETADYFFLEMNTRLQVEHGITEMRYNVDLVHLMLQQADYEKVGQTGIPSNELERLGRSPPSGAAIEARIYAEVPLRDFAPSPGLLQNVRWPQGEGVRVDTWVKSGQNITPYYDPLVGKVMAFSAEGRASAQQKMLAVLGDTTLDGTQTNLEYLSKVLQSDAFVSGNTLTNFLSTFKFDICAIQVLNPGLFTTIQDYPGRGSVGYGIPKSGPMDDVSSRVANILVGNQPGAELLEVTMSGPELLFHSSAIISVCGAQVSVTVDGVEQSMWSRVVVNQGQTLKIGNLVGKGFRTYLAFMGGFPQVTRFLGSKSTAPELGFGGMQGRKLQTHDIIALSPESEIWAASAVPFSVPTEAIPDFDITHVYCMEGPYGSEDILSPEGVETIYNSAWSVSHNSGRSGVRLAGPPLKWARTSGGGGGAHPSNVLDYGYPSGGINWTGDSPLIFGCDSPDLGGFVCPATICSADFWKVGQLKPGDQVKFQRTTFDNSFKMAHHRLSYLEAVTRCARGQACSIPSLNVEVGLEASSSVLHETPATVSRPRVIYRQGGDNSIIVEYGSQVADLKNTTRVHSLSKRLAARKLKSVTFTPHITTITVRYDLFQIRQESLLELLLELDGSIGDATDPLVPARAVRLPICLDHPALHQATQRYMDNLRASATYLPDNVEYIRKSNALKFRRDVFNALLETPWLTVAVGFFVGTPILFPLDPRYLYVGQKYNPSRVYTPSGTIGLGGSLLAIYPVDSPGGYQLMARTLGNWDATGTRPGFSSTRPWLFRHFDLVSFYEVSVEEYDQVEREFAAGNYTFDISETTLDMDHYITEFEAKEKNPAHQEWKRRQLAASEEMGQLEAKLVKEWNEAKAVDSSAAHKSTLIESENAVIIESPVSASVWKIEVRIGDILEKGQTVAILEAMKMEIKVTCADHQAGAVVKEILTVPGTIVNPGTMMIAAVMGD
ncbi:putative Urea amidolyase [Seiridium cardinale]